MTKLQAILRTVASLAANQAIEKRWQNSASRFLNHLDPIERRRYYGLTTMRALLALIDLLALAMVGFLALSIAGINREPFLLFGLEISLSNWRSIPYVLIQASLILSLLLMKSGFSALVAWRLNRLLEDAASRNAQKLFEALLARGVRDGEGVDAAHQTWVLQSAVTAAFQKVPFSLSSVISDTVLSLSVFALLLLVDLQVAIGLGMYLALVGIAYQLLVRRAARIVGRRMASSQKAIQSLLGATASSFREILARGAHPYFGQKFSVSRKAHSRAVGVEEFIGLMPRIVLEVSFFLGLFIVFFLYMSNPEEYSPASLAVFAVAGIRLLGSMIPLQGHLSQLSTEVSKAAAAFDALEMQKNLPALKPASDFALGSSGFLRRFADIGGESIEVQNVVFRVGENSGPLLKVQSLEIPAGKYVAIVGPSGSGKSTLLDLLIGAASPSSGTVRIAGQEASSFLRGNPGKIGYVPQDSGIFPGSVRDNVALEEIVESDTVVWEALDEAGIGDVVRNMPGGLGFQIQSGGGEFSGGQIQRLALARALYTKPSILALDEATNSLDLVTEVEVTTTVANLSYSPTRLVIAHHQVSLQPADLVVVVAEGRIDDFGTLKSVSHRNGIFKRLFPLTRPSG